MTWTRTNQAQWIVNAVCGLRRGFAVWLWCWNGTYTVISNTQAHIVMRKMDRCTLLFSWENSGQCGKPLTCKKWEGSRSDLFLTYLQRGVIGHVDFCTEIAPLLVHPVFKKIPVRNGVCLADDCLTVMWTSVSAQIRLQPTWRSAMFFDTFCHFSFPSSFQQRKLCFQKTQWAGNTCCRRPRYEGVLQKCFIELTLFHVFEVTHVIWSGVPAFCLETSQALLFATAVPLPLNTTLWRDSLRCVCWTEALHSLNMDFVKDH